MRWKTGGTKPSARPLACPPLKASHIWCAPTASCEPIEITGTPAAEKTRSSLGGYIGKAMQSKAISAHWVRIARSRKADCSPTFSPYISVSP